MHTGLYFGSFNPIHIGHLALANYITEYTELDELWFVVSPQNPLKDKKNILADYHRLEMVNIAIEKYPKFKASNIEFSMPQPSYTIDTIARLEEKYPLRTFSIIMGEDNLSYFHKWKNHNIIIEKCNLIVYPRPEAKRNIFHDHPKVTLINAPNIEISSSFIREAIKNKKDIRFFLPQNVWEYIDKMNFYR